MATNLDQITDYNRKQEVSETDLFTEERYRQIGVDPVFEPAGA